MGSRSTTSLSAVYRPEAAKPSKESQQALTLVCFSALLLSSRVRTSRHVHHPRLHQQMDELIRPEDTAPMDLCACCAIYTQGVFVHRPT
jgi:hypothetical protein